MRMVPSLNGKTRGRCKTKFCNGLLLCKKTKCGFLVFTIKQDYCPLFILSLSPQAAVALLLPVIHGMLSKRDQLFYSQFRTVIQQRPACELSEHLMTAVIHP